ncbi:DNA cytosine methyltransferase, partial [Candidatus Halobeggiatoa sp. HSG11]|nr:DNA cytosine methyltransferase [Candidatus Halobeggiatoa sp. HSG11]
MKLKVVDLFCGIGGLSYGLHKSGLQVIAGVDTDSSCQYSFEANCKSKFICEDIIKLKGKKINSLYTKNDIKVLVGCAPCQPFSSYTFKGDKHKDRRGELL